MAQQENRKRSRGEGTSSCFLEAGPSKSFTDSTRQNISRIPSRSSLGIRKLSVEADLVIPMNDDHNELNEENEKIIAEKESSKSESAVMANEEEADLSIVTRMTPEQMQEHVSRCLQLNTENKINIKNAFALNIIDCMMIIQKNDDKSNFAAMACQLDAGAKIYSSRVDAVHQQVMKLADTCMYAAITKKDKKAEEEGSGEDDGGNECDGGKEKATKKKPRKKMIAARDQIRRQPKENDPKEKFIKLEALPYDILNKAKYSRENLSLTLDKHIPFWMGEGNEAKVSEDKVLIPHIELRSRKIMRKLEIDSEIDLSSLPKLSSMLDAKGAGSNFDDMDADDEDDGQDLIESFHSDPEQDEEQQDEDVEVVNAAKSRMTIGGSSTLSTPDVIKTIFHDQGESDYHYLKMDQCNLWAGPSYWKRPHDHKIVENKKKMQRKKKEPAEILYTEKEGEKKRQKASLGRKTMKKTATLSHTTMARWSTKKVTYPQYIDFDPEVFSMLFNMEIVAEVVHQEEGAPEQMDESNDFEDDEVAGMNIGSPDMFANSPGSPNSPPTCNSPSAVEPFRGFSQYDFCGLPSPTPSRSSPFDPNDVFLGWPDESESSQESKNNEVEDNNEVGEPPCDVYEGENLVPMVKTVKVNPIRYNAKPNRVDMQHLKSVMLTIIRRAIEDRENQMREEGLPSPRGSVAFREVLTQLYRSRRLHKRTREDLTPHMAFMGVLTLTNEHSFNLKKDDSGDFLIMYDIQE